jgi:uncharacterized membrane protein YhaH (DUF805 family)
MHWYLEGLRKYAVFSGRARRREYWMFEFINGLVTLALFVIAVYLGKAGFGYFIGAPVLYMIATVIPNFAKLIRRLHDTNHSAWWIFISAVPFIGVILFLYLLFKEGDRGANRFGPDPKALPAAGRAPEMGYLAPPLT